MFGAIYGYLALFEPRLLFDSIFLGILGFAVLASYTYLGFTYWFSTPLRGIVVALACYIVAYLVHVS